MDGHSNPPDRYQKQFGSGFCYSLALFLSHEMNVKYVLAEVDLMAADGALRFEGSLSINEKAIRNTVERLAATRWFSSAVQPLRNLQFGQGTPRVVRQRADRLRQQAIAWALPSSPSKAPTLVNVQWALEEAKEIIRQVDELHGVPTTPESRAAKGLKEPVLVFRDG